MAYQVKLMFTNGEDSFQSPHLDEAKASARKAYLGYMRDNASCVVEIFDEKGSKVAGFGGDAPYA